MIIKNVAILGAGIMGSGIAQVCAQSGFNIYLFDPDEAALSCGVEKIQNGLHKFAGKGKLAGINCDEVLGKVKAISDLRAAVEDAGIVIEAIPENLELKKQIFREIDNYTSSETIFSTNTSSCSITEIASATKRPDKVIGVHFFNPVPIMGGVEVIRGLNTSDETVETVMGFLNILEKKPLFVKDFPGFLINRLIPLFANEAFYLLWQGIASAEDIDRACELMLKHPIGPLKLADFTGLDTLLSVLEYLHDELGEKYRPCPLLKQLVKAGHHGRKTGKGVYHYC